MPIKDLHVFHPDLGEVLADNFDQKTSTDFLHRLTELLNPALETSGQGRWKKFGLGAFGRDYAVCETTVFAVNDFEETLGTISRVTSGTEFDGALGIYRWFENRDENNDNVPYNSIEVYYDVAEIPDGFDNPLDFRNAAMELIEAALDTANAGKWVGAEIGSNNMTGKLEVNFGFEVAAFDEAEAVVRNAVKGTIFYKIREITRFEYAGEG